MIMSLYNYFSKPIITESIEIPIIDSIPELTEWDILWIAISKVESNIDDSARNPRSTATGRYQLLKCVPEDANRILGYEEFTYDDRYDSDRSFAMLEIIHSHYNPKKNIDRAIRIHSIGFAKDSLSIADYKAYRVKVHREMNRIKKEISHE